MAWDRLKLMVALVVLGFLALLVIMNRLDPGRTPSDRRRARWRWSRSKNKKVALIVPAILGLVGLVSHLDIGSAPKERVILERVITECRDEQGRPTPPPWERLNREGTAYGRGDGERVFFQDDKGNEISCSGLLGPQSPRG